MIIPVFLVTSLVLNISALCINFMTFKIMMQKDKSYSIPSSIKLMWDHDYKWAAGLVTAFSLVFPFIKLFSLFAIFWRMPMQSGFGKFYLKELVGAGRFSLLDVFVAILFLTLVHDQGTKAAIDLHWGLPLFMGAIGINILCGEMMLAIQE